MKINWGTGIAIFYTVFVLAMVTAVIRSTYFDNSLVSDNYYADDLNYQQHYDKLANSQALEKDLEIAQNKAAGLLELHFPGNLEDISGEIHFFCPSKSALDFRIPVQPDDKNQQVIPIEKLKKEGLWRVKVDWKAGKKPFYKETIITI
jgi:nitrogen fixation protein FixH